MSIEYLQQRLEQRDKQALTRKRKVIINCSSNANTVYFDGRTYTNFASNDYLGLMNHREISEAFAKATHQYGFGSGSSALVSGYSNAHYELEKQFSKWLGVDRAIIFNSGYLANIGVISALVKRSDTVLSDRLCHASILDGIHLSRAKHYRYAHCSMKHLDELSQSKNPNLIVTESVFSMGGDISPIKEIIQIVDKYQSALVIDDAHGIGILGKQGGGVCEQFGIKQNQFSCLVLPLGKAFNGVGAIVAGRSEIIESILQFSRSYGYTTALPPAICSALQASLKVLTEEQWRRDQLKANIQYFIHHATNMGLRFASIAETPIKALIVGDTNKALHLHNFLLAKGFYVSAIRPPTVPNNSARLRISLNCHHTEQQMTRLVNYISEGIQ